MAESMMARLGEKKDFVPKGNRRRGLAGHRGGIMNVQEEEGAACGASDQREREALPSPRMKCPAGKEGGKRSSNPLLSVQGKKGLILERILRSGGEKKLAFSESANSKGR